MQLTERGELVVGSLTARGRLATGGLTAEGRIVFPVGAPTAPVPPPPPAHPGGGGTPGKVRRIPYAQRVSGLAVLGLSAHGWARLIQRATGRAGTRLRTRAQGRWEYMAHGSAAMRTRGASGARFIAGDPSDELALLGLIEEEEL